MNFSNFKYYSCVGLLVVASAAFVQTLRQSYSLYVADKDAQQLTSDFNSTHKLKIYPDVMTGNDGVVHNFSRLRIESNNDAFHSYSYDLKRRKIEGYEFNMAELPDFLKGSKALSDIHQKACGALKQYTVTDTSYLTEQVARILKRRAESVNYLLQNNCP
jgi:hypothetical protein